MLNQRRFVPATTLALVVLITTSCGPLALPTQQIVPVPETPVIVGNHGDTVVSDRDGTPMTVIVVDGQTGLLGPAPTLPPVTP